MSRGLGRVQNGCLVAISEYERRGELPTTFDIAAEVYNVETDKDDGYRYVSAAQHVAVKRALAGLQHKGHIIGLPLRYCCDYREFSSDFRSLYGFCWMSQRRAEQFLESKPGEVEGSP